MKKLTLLSLIAMLFMSSIQAQDCVNYFPQEEGSEIEMHSFNKRGKLQSITKQKLVSKEARGDDLVFNIHQVFSDDKGENQMENDFQFICKGESFTIDMKTYFNPSQMEAYENMEMDVDADNLEIPASPQPGQELDDGYISITINTGSPVKVNMTANVTNRKVEGIEKVEVPAGTFKCYKISQQVETKMSFMNITQKSITWYAKDVGVVRSESYNKRDKLTGYQELVAIRK
mgnify:CR=1 FL=1